MTYTISTIKSSEEKPKRNGGTFTKYRLDLQDEGEVGFADFDGTNPQEGQTLEGFQIVDEGYGRELKKVGRSNGAKPRGRSPAEQKSIVRQGAQQRAALYLIAKALHGSKEEFNLDQFKTLVDKFVEDAAA